MPGALAVQDFKSRGQIAPEIQINQKTNASAVRERAKIREVAIAVCVVNRQIGKQRDNGVDQQGVARGKPRGVGGRRRSEWGQGREGSTAGGSMQCPKRRVSDSNP